MRRAIFDLERLADDALFRELSEGMPLIFDNAASLDESARRLYRDGELRASDIVRGFGEEEAAKVLILIDYVRCPRGFKKRGEILKRFYSHVAKRIYAITCSYPKIASFGELSKLVESECRPWYLDGPNGIDWILPNAISAEREQALYVDYMRDVTDAGGACHWTAPAPPFRFSSQYTAPDCIKLVHALSEAGACSADGLAEIADVWRGFEPVPDTDPGQRRSLIAETLDRLALCSGAVDEPTVRLIVSHWSFPMWPLTMKVPRATDGDLDGLREERERDVKWIEETEAKRDPAPAISRSTVEELSVAYADWESDVDERTARGAGDKDTGPRIRMSSDFAGDFELPSYAHVRDKLCELNEMERAALVALAWFARERVADWPRQRSARPRPCARPRSAPPARPARPPSPAKTAR